MAHRSERGSGRLVATTVALLAACFVLSLVPLTVTQTPPLFDYPNHLARMHILAHWDRFEDLGLFVFDSYLIPNVLSDILGVGFIKLFGSLEGGRILLATTIVATLSGAIALHAAAAGRLSPWPGVLVLPFLYNEMFFWGFLNYMAGLALVLWGCAAWLVFDRRSRVVQLALGTLFALSTFFAHLVAFGLFAVAIALLELHGVWTVRRGGFKRTAVRLAVSALPFVPALAIFLLRSPSRSLGLDMRFESNLFLKLSPFTRLLSSGNPWTDTLTLLGIAGVIVLLLCKRLARVEPRLCLVAVAFAVLTLKMPYTALGSYFLDSRIAIATALMLLIAVVPRMPFSRTAWLAILLVLSLGGLRTTVMAVDWQAHGQRYARLIEGFQELPRNSLVVAADRNYFQIAEGWFVTRTRHPPYEHAGGYATVVRDAVLMNIFGRRGQNPLVFDPRSEDLARLLRNPIHRVGGTGELAGLVGDARIFAMDDGRFGGRVHLVVFGLQCREWPSELQAEPVACSRDYSLMAITPLPEDVDEDRLPVSQIGEHDGHPS